MQPARMTGPRYHAFRPQETEKAKPEQNQDGCGNANRPNTNFPSDCRATDIQAVSFTNKLQAPPRGNRVPTFTRSPDGGRLPYEPQSHLQSPVNSKTHMSGWTAWLS